MPGSTDSCDCKVYSLNGNSSSPTDDDGKINTCGSSSTETNINRLAVNTVPLPHDQLTNFPLLFNLTFNVTTIFIQFKKRTNINWKNWNFWGNVLVFMYLIIRRLNSSYQRDQFCYQRIHMYHLLSTY